MSTTDRVRTRYEGVYVHPSWKVRQLESECCEARVVQIRVERDPDGWPRARYFGCTECGQTCSVQIEGADDREPV